MILKHMTYNALADTILSQQMNTTLIVDSRSMLEYNDNHIQNAINVCGSKLMKKRLQYNQISVLDLLDSVNCKWSVNDRVVVYDQQTINFTSVTESHFFYVLVEKLLLHFNDVSILSGKLSFFLLYFSFHFLWYCFKFNFLWYFLEDTGIYNLAGNRWSRALVWIDDKTHLIY